MQSFLETPFINPYPQKISQYCVDYDPIDHLPIHYDAINKVIPNKSATKHFFTDQPIRPYMYNTISSDQATHAFRFDYRSFAHSDEFRIYNTTETFYVARCGRIYDVERDQVVSTYSEDFSTFCFAHSPSLPQNFLVLKRGQTDQSLIATIGDKVLVETGGIQYPGDTVMPTPIGFLGEPALYFNFQGDNIIEIQRMYTDIYFVSCVPDTPILLLFILSIWNYKHCSPPYPIPMKPKSEMFGIPRLD